MSIVKPDPIVMTTNADSSATLLPVSPLRLPTYRAYLSSLCFHKGQGGFPQLLSHLSIRVAAATPPPSSYLLASIGKRVLSSPTLKRLSQWNSSFTRLHLRSSRKHSGLRPEYLLASLILTLSMGFRR
jgi:hypothetical protein